MLLLPYHFTLKVHAILLTLYEAISVIDSYEGPLCKSDTHVTSTSYWYQWSFCLTYYIHQVLERTNSLKRSNSIKQVTLKWRQGEPAPQGFTLGRGRAIVQNNTAYFSYDHEVYSFTVPGSKWGKLPSCKYQKFSMAVINGRLTTIGGQEGYAISNALLSLSPKHSAWEDIFPPMPTRRAWPAAVVVSNHLVTAGGVDSIVVEVMDLKTQQWLTADSLPKFNTYNPFLTLCGGQIYLRQCNSIHSCSVKDLLESCRQVPVKSEESEAQSLWTKQEDIPAQYDTSLVVLGEQVLAIGGDNGKQTTANIYNYSATSSMWSIIEQFPTPRSSVLAVALPGNAVMVVGGWLDKDYKSNDVYFGQYANKSVEVSIDKNAEFV